MFGYFRKQSGKDQYVLRVAAILREYIGPAFHAYNLAEECLGDLRDSIANGMFHDGPNPQENVMAYYSICSMISETSSADDKTTVLKLSVMAGILKDQLGAFENMTPLEKGIWQFGEQVLAGGLMAPSADTIAKIKSATVQIIMDLMKDQEVAALEQDVKTTYRPIRVIEKFQNLVNESWRYQFCQTQPVSILTKEKMIWHTVTLCALAQRFRNTLSGKWNHIVTTRKVLFA